LLRVQAELLTVAAGRRLYRISNVKPMVNRDIIFEIHLDTSARPFMYAGRQKTST
jgi:hypothetical protein